MTPGTWFITGLRGKGQSWVGQEQMYAHSLYCMLQSIVASPVETFLFTSLLYYCRIGSYEGETGISQMDVPMSGAVLLGKCRISGR